MGKTTDWRGRRVLITGASGFIGRCLVERALRAGATVITLSRTSANIAGSSAHLMVDIGDRESTLSAIKESQPEAILHVAASGVTDKAEYSEMLHSNTLGTDNLLSAAQSLKAPPPVVMAGSGYEYAAQARPLTEDDPIFPSSPYGISKAAATFCAANYVVHIPITVLRIFNVYGPGERLPRLLPYIVKNATLGHRIDLSACDQIRDFVYVHDLASIFWQVLECSPQVGRLRVLNIGSGLATSLKDFVCVVVRVLERQGIKAQVEFGVRPYRSGEPMYYVANPTRLVKVLGSIPKTPLEVGVAETIATLS